MTIAKVRLVFHLLIRFRWRRIRRQRIGKALREKSFRLGIVCDRRRPRPVDASWPDRIDSKSVAARRSAIAPCRRKRSLLDHRRGQPAAPAARSPPGPRARNRRSALQAAAPAPRSVPSAVGRHATAVIAGDALGKRGSVGCADRHPPPAIPSARNASLAVRIRCSRPSLPRTPTLWPSAEIRISGCGAASAQTTAQHSTAAPDQRSGVRNRPSRMIRARCDQRPDAERRHPADRAGQAATHCVTAIIQSMPSP